MAMQDLVFAHVPNFDVLQQMMQNAEGVIRLQYKPGCSEMAVLRAYTDGQKHIISSDKALKYSTLYKQYEQLGTAAGFEGVSSK
jgi:hypothetical protein